jgi:hypothetical protein
VGIGRYSLESLPDVKSIVNFNCSQSGSRVDVVPIVGGSTGRIKTGNHGSHAIESRSYVYRISAPNKQSKSSLFGT